MSARNVARVARAAALRAIIACIAILAGVSSAPAAPPNDPFRGVDIVKLFARTPGTVASESFNSQPVQSTAARFEIAGRPDERMAVSGRLNGGQWALLVPFTGAGDAMVYVATARGIRAAGSIHAPTARGELVAAAADILGRTADCCYPYVRVVTDRYDRASHRLRAIDERREKTNEFSAAFKRHALR